MIVGKGDNEESLKKLALELGILDRVIFAGFHSDPTPFYASADLFVLSSDYEGLPTVLIEALNFGLHIVSTDCPSGPSEILENGRWGRLVPIGDVTALANAMGEGLFIKPDRHALRKRGAEFSPEIAARKYLALIEGNK
jgi:glycosyltransferase involved in cell wall biosynthesis